MPGSAHRMAAPTGRTDQPPARPPRRRSRSRLALSGRLLHLFGILAMVVGLILPLTNSGLAAAAPASPANAANMRFQGAPQQVTMTCDGQAPACQGSQLTNNDGIWTGTFELPAGSYNWQFQLTGGNGQPTTVGPNQLTVND